MTTLEEQDDVVARDDQTTPVPPRIADDHESSGAGDMIRTYAKWAFITLVIGLAIVLLITQEKARSTLVLVVTAVVLSGGVWVAANLLVDQARKSWARFNALLYGVVGALVAAALSGNRLIDGAGEGDGFFGRMASFLWLPLVVGVAVACVGLVLSRTEAVATRYAVGAGGLGAVGAVIGLLLRDSVRPEIDIVPIVAWTAALAAVGAALSLVRKRPPVVGALFGAPFGWAIGAFGMPELGAGSVGWSIVAAGITGALVGLRLAMTPHGGDARARAVDQKARPIVFLAPALLFVTVTLVIPAIRTFYLSLFDADGEEFVGADNYIDTFRDPTSWDSTNWTNMFTSRPTIIGAILLIAFVIIGAQMKRRTGKIVELGSPSMGPLVAGSLFLAFGVFTALRGTIVNNMWWVVVVTLVSTSLGLAVAVLADGVKFEKVAKSFIFMPMAISLVGASVIWRFMYVARDSTKEQTGVLNAVWVGLGRLSTGQAIASTVLVALVGLVAFGLLLWAITERRYVIALLTVVGAPALLFGLAWLWAQLSGDVQRLVVGAVLTAVFVGMLAAAVRAVGRGNGGQAVVPGIAALLLGWFLIRYWGIIGGGVGGQRTDTSGAITGDPINFIQSSPYNNVFLMVVLIWIQTGFAMVILSAAIKAVPDDIIEAARVDGATTSQVFWRVTLPQIGPTIGVVVTTIIVLVMKVFDIVKVMTNSNFGTQVLANDMYAQAFQFTNYGRGAALAMLIFFSVMPIMVMNIRRMQKEG